MSSPACATTASLLLVLVAVCAPLTSSAGALVVSGRPSRGLLDGAVRLLSSVLATQSCATPAQSAGCVIGSTGGGDDGDLVAAYGRNLQRPECAISMLDLGVEPVVASDGYTYRLSPLMTWCARFDYGSCTSPLTRETIRPEVYYNQDLEVVMNTWGDQVRRKRHGTTMSWVQRFCADTVVICPDEGGHGGGCPRRPQRAATAGPGTRCRKVLGGCRPCYTMGRAPHADDVAMCPAEWRDGRRCTCRRRPDADPDTVSGPAAFMALGDAIQDNRPIRAGRDTPDPLQEAQCRHIGGRRGRGTVVARTCRQSADQPAEGREDGQCGRIPDVRLQTMPPGSTMVLVVLAIGFPVAWSGTSSPTPPLVVQGSPPSPGFIARTAGCLSSAPCLPDVDRAPIGVVPDDDDAISDLIEEYGRGVDPPECPISMLDLDAEPVVASDGHTYRLSTLMDWCARFSRGRCLSPISQVPIRAEVYYNQDLEMVATSWSDQVRWWRHGVTLPWVQRFNASKAMICADGRSYTVAEVGAYHLITACYVNLALAEAAAKIAELGTFSTDQQEILRPAAERMAQRCPMMRALSPRRQTSH